MFNNIKHLNGYVIGGKTGNCNVYVRPSHGAKVRCMVVHIKPIIRDKLHLTERTTNILSTTFVREISNIFRWQCVLSSTNEEVTGRSNFGGYKSNSEKFCTGTNHLGSLRTPNFCTP